MKPSFTGPFPTGRRHTIIILLHLWANTHTLESRSLAGKISVQRRNHIRRINMVCSPYLIREAPRKVNTVYRKMDKRSHETRLLTKDAQVEQACRGQSLASAVRHQSDGLKLQSRKLYGQFYLIDI